MTLLIPSESVPGSEELVTVHLNTLILPIQSGHHEAEKSKTFFYINMYMHTYI